MGKQTVKDYIAKHSAAIEKMSLEIWARPEAGFREDFASEAQMKYLKEMGAKITAPVGDVKTAFIAEYGSGKPIIGVLGEFDALPGLSQKAWKTEKDPVTPGAYGHACGHNLLGCGGLISFAALMETMKDEKLAGTIRFYACPAEENLSGKSYMAREGVFDDLDCCMSWHPGGTDAVGKSSCNAFQLMEFHFKGTAAHAGGAPHLGRSALDAVELTNVGANYLREHIIDAARMHYIITDGGQAVNIVPETATVRYAVRAPKMYQMQEVVERLVKVAKGAATMTETEMTYEVKSIYHNMMPNYTLSELLYENYKAVTPSQYTKEELDFVNAMAKNYPEGAAKEAAERVHADPADLKNNFLQTPIIEGDKSISSGGSTDVGDVSWITPTGQITAACAPIMVSAHTWQAAACYGTTFATKGMIRAGEVMATTMYDLLTDKKDLIEKAKEELKKDRGSYAYSPIPKDMKPYLD